jgi:D-alanyl-D-alanine carboxypeptidase (penicillin-binding protein 5/6)
VTVGEDITVVLSRRARDDMKVSVRYDGPISAPIVQGDRMATLVIEAPDAETVERPLFALSSVEKLGAFSRALRRINGILFGAIRDEAGA